MNWISALGPMQWLMILAVPPAVLSLYFLKLKRKEIAVPSTLLWRRTLEDVHVNSIWQRLRKNLLLYLQFCFLGSVDIGLFAAWLEWSKPDRRASDLYH